MRRIGVAGALAAFGLASCRVGPANHLFGEVPASDSAGRIGGLIQVTGAKCTTTYKPSIYGHVVYTSETYGHVYRIEAQPGAIPEDVSYELDKLGTGTDSDINISPDGQWLLTSTTRFGCGATDCLALISQDACSAEVVIDSATGGPINADEWSAVGVLPDGDIVVVYPGSGGPHAVDLFAIKRHAGAWGASLLLTAQDPYPYNAYVTLSPDSTTLYFDCGTNSYSGGKGTSICEVAVDGTGFRVVHSPSDGPSGGGSWPLHKANYSPSGAIVFEGEWPGGAEIIWEYPPGEGPPAMVNTDTVYGIPAYTDDNTPCVLPDGRIVSLWLERPGATKSEHEIKVMNADGTGNAMLVIDQNVDDIGHGCGK